MTDRASLMISKFLNNVTDCPADLDFAFFDAMTKNLNRLTSNMDSASLNDSDSPNYYSEFKAETHSIPIRLLL